MRKIMSAVLVAHSFSKVQNFDNLFIDPYQGCHVKSNLNDYLSNITLFKQHIADLLEKAKTNKYSAIWIDLKSNQLILAKTLADSGFQMHRVTDNKLQFSKWLKDSDSKLPEQASHFVGVGGVIVKDDCILLVQEKNGTRKGAWGIPGGSVDPKESLIDAVLREIREETNLQCQVNDLLYFRELHDTKYGKTDIYFAFKLTCNNYEQIRICEKELMNYKWVPVPEMQSFLNGENQKPHVINFYKSIQQRLQELGANKQFMKIEGNNDNTYVYKPKF